MKIRMKMTLITGEDSELFGEMLKNTHLILYRFSSKFSIPK